MHADLVIIGGGLVGASLAAAVSSHPLTKPLTVLLIDPSPPSSALSSSSAWPPLSSPPRTSTITPSSHAFLADVGAWSLIPEARIAPVESMIVWDQPQAQGSTDQSTPSLFNFFDSAQNPTGLMSFSAADIGQDILAYVVDNDTLRTALFHSLRSSIENPARDMRVVQSSVQSIEFSTDENSFHSQSNDAKWPVITLNDGSTIHARLIAACDGPRSRTRTLLGADWLGYNYGESAVVANVRVQDANCVAYQRFLSTGPLALLPLAADDEQYHPPAGSAPAKSSTVGPLANVVWTTTRTEAQALVAVDDAEFLNELNIALSENDMESDDGLHDISSSSVSDSSSSSSWSWSSSSFFQSASVPSPPVCTGVVGRRGSFPLHAGHAPRYVFPKCRTVLVGDAAHAVHPLAGQGVNLGFADARALADCIADAATAGRDIGGELGAPLRRYEFSRLAANSTAVAGLHALRTCFALNRGPTRSVRRLGMSLIDGISPVKRSILRFMR